MLGKKVEDYIKTALVPASAQIRVFELGYMLIFASWNKLSRPFFLMCLTGTRKALLLLLLNSYASIHM